MAMRDGWTETTLGEVATFEYGKPLKAENRDGIGFPVFGSAGEVGRHSEPLIDDAPVIVVGRKGTAGAVWWSELPCSVIDTAYYVVPKMSINFNFLFLLLGFIDLPSLSAQTGVPGLNRDRAYSSEVNLPPLAEQKQIVDVVSSVDAFIDALQQQVDTARTARNAVLHELLSAGGDDWTEATLGEVAVFYNGKAYKQDELLADGKYRVLRVGNFFSNGNWYWSDLELDSNKYCDQGDLLYAWSASFGPRIWSEEKVIYHYHIWKVVEDPLLVDKKFLYYWLEDDVQRMKRDAGTGSIMMHITKGEIEARAVLLPPLTEQKRIVEIVSSMDDVIQSTEQALLDAKNLRSGLLSDLLSGEHEIPESYDRFVGAA